MAFQWIGKSPDGKTVTLKRLESSHFQFPQTPTPPELIRTGVVLDVETTGLNSELAQIIEIGLRSFTFNKETGHILSLADSYSAFQDPGIPLDPEIVSLTGITDEMLQGQTIDWKRVDQVLSSAQIIIAHNAAFDRPFIEKNQKFHLGKFGLARLNNSIGQ